MNKVLSETTAKNSSFSTETPLITTPKQFLLETSYQKSNTKTLTRPSSSRKQSTTSATSIHKTLDKTPEKRDEFSFNNKKSQTIPTEKLFDTDFSAIDRPNTERGPLIRSSTPNPGSSRLLRAKGSMSGGMKAQTISLELKTNRPSSKASY